MSPLRIVLAHVIATCGLMASPLVHDLGEGLGYVQIRKIPGDLPGSKESPEAKAWVIDLRGAHTNQAQARTLLAWLRFLAKPDRPAMVLLNNDTTGMLRTLIEEAEWPALITLAPAAAEFHADILVDTSLEADRKAEESLVAGKKPDELISIAQTKERWDEEVLAKDRQNGGTGIAPLPSEQGRKPGTPDTNGFKPGDQVLARAVQIHRGLIALRAINTGSKQRH